MLQKVEATLSVLLVVILSTNHLNLQCDVVTQQVARIFCPYYLAFKNHLLNSVFVQKFADTTQFCLIDEN